MDDSSGEPSGNDIESQDNDTSSTASVGNTNEVTVNDFTILDSIDSDDDSDFDLNCFDSNEEEDPIDGWNLADIEG